ncbi:hypothetical protein [Armatimonas rosea]|uniref:Uncharacterized protein n=1 Tax=Armatimonas rosea TaxID=685828 RepID=A0A7W9W557_ARMRO|nr:hypothetical protein [Armatimonas rosea]MBB6048242.1 hypothetical protein [Armatimonas rosea]
MKNALTVLGILIALGYAQLAERFLHHSPTPQKPVTLNLKPAVVDLPDYTVHEDGPNCGNGPE